MWRDAINNLATLSVTGVTTSYDLDTLPNSIPAVDLPALLPVFPSGLGQRRDDEQGLASLTYDGSAWQTTLHLDHVLLWSAAWSEAGLTETLPALLDAVDDYLAAVADDGDLSGVLDAPLAIERVQVGVIDIGGVAYYGARFRHRWVQVVGS